METKSSMPNKRSPEEMLASPRSSSRRLRRTSREEPGNPKDFRQGAAPFDANEGLGRDVWNEDGKDKRLLALFSHRLANWAFYPVCLGPHKAVKKHGQAGIHYAAGYAQLGEMVLRQGRDYTKWPRLEYSNDDNKTDDVGHAVPEPIVSSVRGTNDTASNVRVQQEEAVAVTVTPAKASVAIVSTPSSAEEEEEEQDNNEKEEHDNADIVTPAKMQAPAHQHVVPSHDDIETKRKVLAYKMDLVRSYRELKKDFGMDNAQIAKNFPDMKDFFSDEEEA